jgi:hypothetical protein
MKKFSHKLDKSPICPISNWNWRCFCHNLDWIGLACNPPFRVFVGLVQPLTKPFQFQWDMSILWPSFGETYPGCDQFFPILIACWTSPLSNLQPKMEKFGHNLEFFGFVGWVVGERGWVYIYLSFFLLSYGDLMNFFFSKKYFIKINILFLGIE